MSVYPWEIWRFAAMRLTKNITFATLSRSRASGLCAGLRLPSGRGFWHVGIYRKTGIYGKTGVSWEEPALLTAQAASCFPVLGGDSGQRPEFSVLIPIFPAFSQQSAARAQRLDVG